MKTLWFRIGLSAGLGFSSLAAQADVSADKRACLIAYEKAQELRKDGKLLGSREQLIQCVRSGCSATVISDCATWLGEVETNLPTVVVDATDAQGKELSAVRVIVDAQLWLPSLDGRAHELDPGNHTIRFETDKGERSEQKIVVREGEKNRKVSVRFGGSAPVTGEPKGISSSTIMHSNVTAHADRPSAFLSSPILFYTVSAVGLAGLGLFTYGALSGKGQQDDLKKSCSPRCRPDQLDPVRQKYLLGDIGLGVGIVAIGTATWLLFTQHPFTAKATAKTLGSRGAWEITPSTKGSTINYRTTF